MESYQERIEDMRRTQYLWKRHKKLIIGISIAVAVLIIGVAVLLGSLLSKSDSKEKEKSEGKQHSIKVEEIKEKIEDDPLASIELEKAEEEVQLPNLKTSEYETNKITLGIDVSEFQGNINWKAVADSGIDFAMIRVGYRGMKNGKIIEDACARYNLQEATKYGLKVGAYFFSTAITGEEAIEEANWTANLLDKYEITYPVAYNCEGFQNQSSRQHGLTNLQRTECADTFLKTVESRGYTGMFYAAMNELEGNSLWDADRMSLSYRTWVAQYSAISWPEKERPDYSKDYVMWQYTNQGRVSGIKGAVDLNVAYFGYSQSSDAIDGSGADEVGINVEVGVKFEEVSQQVTAKENVNLRSTMDQGGRDNIVCSLKNGDVATRTGVGNNGWSRVIYNGKTLYCVSSYITTDLNYKPPTQEVEEESEFKTKFTAVNEKVTAKELTNLRNMPSTTNPSSKVIVELKNGEVITRIGISTNGGDWSKVECNGQILYCVSSLLELVE